MPGIEKECMEFLYSIMMGCNLCLSYRILSIVRKIIKHARLCIWVEDILYWILAALYFFVGVQNTMYSVLRWQLILGVVVGAVVSYGISKKTEKSIENIRKKE